MDNEMRRNYLDSGDAYTDFTNNRIESYWITNEPIAISELNECDTLVTQKYFPHLPEDIDTSKYALGADTIITSTIIEFNSNEIEVPCRMTFNPHNQILQDSSIRYTSLGDNNELLYYVTDTLYGSIDYANNVIRLRSAEGAIKKVRIKGAMIKK